ncbi:MAG TPA: M64 family metallopeptidase [Thermoanaerobaculaceae bacterium]|nr:M64 family metallopeptidase [Thermoanaerobaculaceae bacterium]
MPRFAFAALLLAAAPLSAQSASPLARFDRFFADATMRVDLYHTGSAGDELFALDEVYRQGAWAGSRVHLTDDLGVGRYLATVSDAASGELLFSRGFDDYFGEYRTTAGALKGVRRTFHESVLIPYPKAKVTLALVLREPGKAPRPIFSAELDPAALTVLRKPLDAGVEVIEVANAGDPHAKVDVAFLAEGYTAAEEPKFRADLVRFARIFFAAEPYASHRSSFNLWGVFKPSQDSGADEPSWGSFKNTALSTTFDSLGSERYLLTEANKAMRDLAAHVPYDAIYIMVNSPRYGGGGIYNLYCTFTTDNQWHEYVFLHEFGHTFAGLADEYYTSSVAYNDFYPKGVEPNEPNVTALLDPANLKWKELLTPGIALPTPWEKTEFDSMDNAYQKLRGEWNERIAAAKRAGAPRAEVEKLQAESERLSKEQADKVDAYLARSRYAGQVGAFEGAGYAATGIYRPMVDCIMFSKGAKPFCRVCQRAIERVIAHDSE